MKTWIQTIPPIQQLIFGYLGILLVGFLLLCLPFAHAQPISVLDNLFIATSALSTTGLATLNIAESYTWLGELLILLLIQVGGLGYMSLGSFIVLLRRKKLSPGNTSLIQYDFSLPEGFNVRHFVKDLVLFSVLIELFGAIFLSLIFWQAGESDVIWKGIFHSISAFCTAGFSLFSDGFEGYSGNFYLNLVITLLSVGGALGFIVFTDLFEKFRGKKKQITFTSRIIMRFTFVGLLFGAGIIFLSDTRIANIPADERLIMAIFQSMTAFTTVGFNTYPIGEMAAAPLFFLLLLMVVGASPSGTGGGMKSTTVTALFAQLKCTFRGDQKAVFMKKMIPQHRIRMATSNFFFYVLVICLSTYLLLLVQPQDSFQVLFEAVSALGTVGLSMGLTGDLSVLGKVFVIVLMFLGRIGPLSLGIALFGSEKAIPMEEEDVAI